MAVVESTTVLEQRALEWIAPFSQAHHLVRAREWVVELEPDASQAARLAALTHDIERMFPGGPEDDKANGRWVDPDYLFAHSTRSGDLVREWLGEQADLADAALIDETRRLVLLHELGGDREADLVQASDSLSWFETLAPLAARWVQTGVCSPLHARSKLQWMHDRIRHDRARVLAAPLLADALRLVESFPTREDVP